MKPHHRYAIGENQDQMPKTPQTGGQGADQSLQQQLDEARKQLLQANKMLLVGQMMSSVTHELNSPLNSVLGYTQLLLQKVSDPAIRDELEKIESAANQAIKVIQSLLSFVRQHEPERQIVNVNDVVHNILEMQKHHMFINNIRVSLSLDPELPVTMADPHQIGQVVLNLLINAEQAVMGASDQRNIRITTMRHNEDNRQMIRLIVQDNGAGIADEDMKHIFEPFFTTKDKGKGTGLGLAICQQIVEEHQGRLSVTSGLGTGAIFTLDLPEQVMVEDKYGGTDLDDTDEVVASSGHGLVVDDEESIREFVKEALTAAGHQMDAASSGMEAFEYIKERKYDFIICDLRMPKVGGQTFYDVVQGYDRALSRQIIFITGDTVNLDTQKFFEQTGNAYIYKPFGISDLTALVNRVVVKRQS